MPSHANVFHIQRQCEGLANTLARLVKGATSRRRTLQARIGRAGQRDPDSELGVQLELARHTAARASCLARDIRTLVQWLRHDFLALAGPVLATRQELFDFVVEELARREPEDARRIRPVRVALQNQRDDLLAFAGVPNGNLVPAGTNLAGLFDVARSEIDASGSVRTTADWVIGGALAVPTGKHSVTINASVTNNAGHTGTTKSIVAVSNVTSGRDLTP